MQRKPDQYSWRMHGIRLRRSDLRRIAEILTSDDRYTMTIETDSHHVQNVEELIAFKEPLLEITFRRRSKQSLRFHQLFVRGDRASLHFDNVDDADIGIGTRLHSLFAQRRTWVRYDVDYFALWVLAGFFLAAVTMLCRVFFGGRSYVVQFALGATSFASLFVGLVGFLSRRGRDLIKFRIEPGERTPIKWRAVSWQVTMALFVAALSVAGTLLVQHLRR